MDQIDTWDPQYYNYEYAFNAGVWVGGKMWSINEYQPILDDLTVRRCKMLDITHGLGIGWYYPNRYRNRVRNLIIEDCYNTGGYGMYLFHINGGHMKRCWFYDGEDGFMPTGTTQTIIQTSQNFTIDNCVFEGTSRQGGTADGTSFDFEGDTYNCVFSNNVSYHTDGQSLLLLNTGGPNKDLMVRDSIFFDTCNDALDWDGHNYEIAGGTPSQGTLQNLTFYTDKSYGLYSPTAGFDNFVISNVNEYPMSTIKGRPYYWHFNLDGNLLGWGSANDITGINVSGGSLNGLTTGSDPFIYSPLTWVVAVPNPTWTLSMKADAGANAQVFFITHNDQTWDQAKSVMVPLIADGQFHTYTLDMFSSVEYGNVITQVRIDPTDVSGAEFAIDYLKLGSPGRRVQKSTHYADSFSVIRGTYQYDNNNFYGAWDADILRQKEFCFNICYNPNDYVRVISENYGDYRTATEFYFSGIPQNSETLRLELYAKEDIASLSSEVQIKLYNYITSSFDLIGTFNASTGYTTRIIETPEGQAWQYIDGTGQAMVKVFLFGTAVNTIYHDYLKITSIERLEFEGDMDLDGDVDMTDFSWFSAEWNNYIADWTNGFFDGTDINTDGQVDLSDFVEFMNTWLY
jgi:hypothetical protein